MFLVLPGFTISQENVPATLPPQPSLVIMESMASKMAADVIKSAGLRRGDSVTVMADSGNCIWLLEQSFLAGLREGGMVVFTRRESAVPAAYTCDVRGIEFQVRYSKPFTASSPGGKRVAREISGRASFRLEKKDSGEILFSGPLTMLQSDAITLDELPELEQGCPAITHAEIPSEENVLDKLVEPFVIIGATGVAIYLLFHIRS